jgi:glutamate transport system substrate-binding protein
MNLRKAGVAAATVLALSLTAAACGSDDDGGGDGDGGAGGGSKKITVGIKYDQPGVGLKEDDGSFTGMDVDVANYVAKELGYDEVEFKESPSAERENMIKRGDVKFVVASYSINDERKELVSFAGPYFLAHQDLLIRSDDNVKAGEDLNGKTLCSVAGSTSAQNVKTEIAPKAELAERGTYSECVEALANGAVDALTTDDSILAGYAAQEQYKGKFKLAGLSLSDENYGIGLKKGDTKLQGQINDALTKMVDDGTWEKVVKENFGPAKYEYEPAPEVTEKG